ncbi:hypothetical protein KC722_02910 [Candidatus Kaiserbacteria bacterium]|nr:hypothetical protein [Candidatus Kaiserbacteria bacterium]MCB9811856.1 hypothetical protein [Candidatus Nomurabacteria bacterium]
MKAEDIKKAPKLFAENIKLGYTPEYFVMGISSGNQAQIYTLTPAHAKRLKQYLEHELKDFEAKHGEITAEWNPNVVSPVQRANPPSEGS